MVGDAEAAEDITQEVFATFFRHAAEVGAGQVEGWLYRTARNRVLNFKRKAAYDKRKHEKAAEIASTAGNARADVDTAGIEEAIAALPEKHRTAIVLYYLQEKKQSEIALILDIPKATVKTNVFRGLKKLAAIARRMGIDESE